MDWNLFLSYLAQREEITESQKRRIQIKMRALAQSIDEAILRTPVLDSGTLLRIQEEFRRWFEAATPFELERLRVPPGRREIRSTSGEFADRIVEGVLEDALEKRMDAVVLRFDERSLPALEIIYRVGPSYRDGMAFEKGLADSVVAAMHRLAGTGPVEKPTTLSFWFETTDGRHPMILRQSARRAGKEEMEIRLRAE